ncbi:MAG: NADH-quinone oxidoreductase subunit M, partial [Acidimicrobiia bacterium]
MNDIGFPILTAIIVTPAVGALVVALLPAARVEAARAVGYATTAATFGLTAWLLWNFATGRAGYQFVESERWMGSLGVKYIVGVDGISIFMIALTALLFPIGLLASNKLTERVGAFTAWMLLLEA